MSAALTPRIEHANLVVTAIGPTLDFLTAAFPEWRVRGEGRDAWKGMARRWVHVGDDDFYVTLNDFGRGRQRDLDSDEPGLAHIGFVVDSIEDVVARLEKAGYEPSHWGPAHPFRRNVYFIDEEGLEFEFVEYLSDDPAEKNRYV
ncbi:VOC family protein [Amphiplicatus metriothermophilus]|uniref:Glyoxalase/Bleomycin resistance protein/Dioxygenase superfamily protein n=1 Tax=Amphiplicatus metriothermophilus TaxID=1519374 RepID=A0A239PIX9_9PROT|nr:VOC family protein [Amphiplicatus metriothermophilus]MBB5518079.1 catechol 2,3-dioxygenase-like lactoylglutathione lyase family enzyme [Amphiplicatus metriothermophilus]SNT67587.1 Glyoxalase/Bleomycin resistance protein/Dioxygenase superfamily protein [Amphiplicatus metriothermophilus]